MMSSSGAINYKWSSKNWLGSSSPACFQLSKEKMEVRGELSAIETEEEKQNSTFHLDRNNAPCLSQRDDQRSRKKT